MSDLDSLRKKAYSMLEKKKGVPFSDQFASEDLSRLLHELDVYQAELEVQNQELLEKEQTLQELYLSNATLFENAPIPYFLMDEEHRILKANHCATEFFATTFADNKRKSIFLFMEERKSINRFLSWIRRRSYGKGHMELHLHPFGNDVARWFQVYAGDYPRNQGWLIVSMIDVDQEKKLKLYNEEKSRELETLNEELEARVQKQVHALKEKQQLMFQQSKFAAMGEMVSNIAHQWRQPLNLLSLTIMEFAMRGAFSAESVDSLELETSRIIRDMSRTIDDFRNFFRPEKAKSRFPVRHAVDEVLAMVGESFQKHGIALELAQESEDLNVVGYENELKHVLLNIINNSKDAILGNQVNPGHIRIELYQGHRGDAIITIKDNGGGIPQQAIHSIFEPYFTTKLESNGTGIGLYMSKMIVEESMGGTLLIENKGKGVLAVIALNQDSEGG